MKKNRKTLKMPVRYLMNAVLVVLLFLALSYMTGNMLSTYQNKVLMTVGILRVLRFFFIFSFPPYTFSCT